MLGQRRRRWANIDPRLVSASNLSSGTPITMWSILIASICQLVIRVLHYSFELFAQLWYSTR